MKTTITPTFNQLVENYYQPVFRFAASLCGSPETALALTQNTFRRANERAGRSPTRADVRQWLFTMLFLEFLEQRPRYCPADRADGNY